MPSPRRAKRLALEDAARKGCNCAPDVKVAAYLGGDSWHLETQHDDDCAVLAEFGEHRTLGLLFPGGTAA